MPDSPPTTRRRSRSPDRREKPRKKKDGGFKWKEKKSSNEAGGEEPKSLERGYRERSPRRDSRPTASSATASSTAAAPPVPGSVEDKFGVSIDDKFGAGASAKLGKDKKDGEKQADTSQPPPRKAATGGTTAPKPSNEAMIIVHVNDRLGTKAAIPALPSDTIGMFKHMVAARVGRPVHELLLKRQSERPFKDQLTLEDYGISNGVQIDLEIDTGG